MKKALQMVLKTHCYESVLNTRNPAYVQAILAHLQEPLLADLDADGDITTMAVLAGKSGKRRAASVAQLIARQAGVMAGIDEVSFFLKEKWPTVKLSSALADGSSFKKGAVLGLLEGSDGDILKLERTILNFLQHLCGVATLARAYVEACQRSSSEGKYPVLVCPTRKTPWGLLDKRACALGGAGTHRLNLADAVLVKDTHLDLLGHDFKVLEKRLLAASKLGRFVEIEAESVGEAWKAVDVLLEVQKKRQIPCFVMLDNIKPQDIQKFVRALRSDKPSSQKYGGIGVEASGGITLKNIQQYAQTGVDVLSVGAMTHSTPVVDIALKIAR